MVNTGIFLVLSSFTPSPYNFLADGVGEPKNTLAKEVNYLQHST